MRMLGHAWTAVGALYALAAVIYTATTTHDPASLTAGLIATTAAAAFTFACWWLTRNFTASKKEKKA